MSDHPFSVRQLAYLSPWIEDVSQARMESLGITGGFSGAVIWRVSVAGSRLCLRRWPQIHPSLTGLLAIHGLLQHVARRGCAIVPVPLATRNGETYFTHEDHLWELTPWMPGEANFTSDPTTAKLNAAMKALAHFHQTAESYGIATERGTGAALPGDSARWAPSPGLRQRLAMIKSLQQGELQQLWQQTRSAEASDLRELAFELLEGVGLSLHKVRDYLEPIAEVPLPLQWCLRDIRHDHLLFESDSTGERVSGLLDFGAVAVDSVVGDLARLLGSIVHDHADAWQAGVAAYEEQRALSATERQAIVGFDQGGLLCSAANWVRWLFVDGREFPQVHALHAQLLWLRDRLRSLATAPIASIGPQLAGPGWGGSTGKSPPDQGLAPPLQHQALQHLPQKHPRPQHPPLGRRPPHTAGPTDGGSPHDATASPWMHT